jgi:putative transposase
MPKRMRHIARRAAGARIIGFEVGSEFWYGTTLVRIERVAGPDKLLVRHLATQRLEHLTSAALRAVVPGLSESAEPSSTPIETYSEAAWERARTIERVIRSLELRQSPSRSAEARAARELGVSTRHLRRWRGQYRTLGTLDAFLPRRAGRKAGTRLLSPRLEQLIDDEVRAGLKRSADIAVNDIYPLICASATALRVSTPARSTVARRMAFLKRDASNFAPDTARVLTAKRIPVRGRLVTTGALSVVQIDHTLADVILVEPVERRPIGRPWLTLALDVHTRTVLGMLLSLEAPGSLSVALVLDHAVFPKQMWAERLGVESDGWPGFGLPARLHLDNGVEFRARALIRGCELYGMGLDYRPVATPRFGGAIERMIGTVMGKVRLLPGATMSRTLDGRPRRTEARARFTLSDLYVYLARQIGIYHHTRHSSLDRSPSSAWEQAMRRRDEFVMPQLPADREEFLVRFLPSELRTVTREGVRLFGLRYQSHELEALIAPGKPRFVRYDPRDLSRVFVEGDGGRAMAVPLSDRHWPALSLWEWHEIRRRQVAGTETGDAEWVTRALRANQALITDRASIGRLRDRRRLERARLWTEARAPTLHADRELTVSATLKDTPLLCEVLE